MRHNGDRSLDEIQAEIERTRTDLNETLSAIEQRLTPGQLVDQGIDYLRHSGAREYVANLGASAKQDPLPLALVGIGLAWLMVSNRRDPQRQGVVSGAGPSAHALAEGARDAAASVRDTVDSAIAAVGEKVSSVREGADRVRSGFDRLVHEQPLALGALGIGIGAMLAATAPRTRQEDGLLGDASDLLKGKAKEAGVEQIDRVTAALATGSAPEVDGANGGRPVGQAP